MLLMYATPFTSIQGKAPFELSLMPQVRQVEVLLDLLDSHKQPPPHPLHPQQHSLSAVEGHGWVLPASLPPALQELLSPQVNVYIVYYHSTTTVHENCLKGLYKLSTMKHIHINAGAAQITR